MLAAVLAFGMNLSAEAAFLVARGGKAKCVIVRQTGATVTESNAVRELAETLEKITGAKFEVRTEADGRVPKKAIVVGTTWKPPLLPCFPMPF